MNEFLYGDVLYMVKLYTIECPKCKVLRRKLDEKKINYEICSDIEEMKCLGIMSAPMLEVDDKIFNFSEAIKWISNKK